MTRVYFTDRALGKQFPAILREAGISVERHADHFADNAADEEWLTAVARKGWIAVTHDQRIRYKVNQRDAVMNNGLALLVVMGKAPFSDLARSFAATIGRIERFLERNRRPLIAKVYRATEAELARRADAPGRVELWLSETSWAKGR